MQATTALAPSPPQASAPAIAGGAKTIALDGPTTIAELHNLRARQSELSSQIGNVTSRRNDIASQLRSAAPGADKAGLEARLNQMDARIVAYEKDLDVTGRLLANARGAAASYTQPQTTVPQGDLNSDQITGIAIVFTIAVMMPLAIAMARAIVRRAKRDAEAPSAPLMNRLDRMDEGIEAIAIEVERISEGQRFVNKLLGEGAASPLAGRQAVPDPVVVSRAEPARIERGG